MHLRNLVTPVAALPLVLAGASAVATPDNLGRTIDEPVPGADVGIPMGYAFADGLGPYAGDDFDKLTFPPGDMTAPRQIAAESSGQQIYGYDFTPDGSVLYGVLDSPPSLVTVDQVTGATAVVGPMPRVVGEHWVDLTIDPVSGRAYASTVADTLTSYALYSVDLGTGAPTLIKSVAFTAMPIDMAMNCEGTMFAESLASSNLYRVDLGSGQMNLVGPLGKYLEYAQGMDFDNATGVLHAWLGSGAGGDYSSINTTTGMATSFPGTEPSGRFEGAIKSECPAPTATVSSGPDGRTADPRPTFGFATTYAASAQCSLDRGTPVFGPCTVPSFQPPAALTPGAWTFRVRGVRGAHTAEATRSFTLVDCPGLRSALTTAETAVAKAKAQLKKAKKSGRKAKVKAAKRKLAKARRALVAAQGALTAEPVCR